jgi:hypothetical protein
MNSFKKFYSLIIEDAASTKNDIFNNLIKRELGFQIFKNKNKPENFEVINSLKERWNPVISRLEEIVNKYNPNDKNLIDLKDLIRLYEWTVSFEVIEDDYKNYVRIPSLKNKKFLQNAQSYTEFAEKVHSEMKKDENKAKAGTSDDPNKVFEDENVIVFLANTGDPISSENNCITYGKGSALCISGSSSSRHYNYYRWERELTTYFIWLKNEQRYILVDAFNKDDGSIGYSYNNVRGNSDILSSKKDITQKYPVLGNAFNNNVFIPKPIEGREKEIYERLNKIHSILDLGSLEDKILFASIKEVDINDLSKLEKNELKEVLKVLVEKDKDLPHDLLEDFDSLKKRYWKVRENNVLRELAEWDEDNVEDFTSDEYKVLWENEELYKLLEEKIPKYKITKEYYDSIKDKEYLHEIGWSATFPLNLPQLKESGYIVARNATTLNLPQLKESGNIDAEYATTLNLPQLKESGNIYAINAKDITINQSVLSNLNHNTEPKIIHSSIDETSSFKNYFFRKHQLIS